MITNTTIIEAIRRITVKATTMIPKTSVMWLSVVAFVSSTNVGVVVERSGVVGGISPNFQPGIECFNALDLKSFYSSDHLSMPFHP